MSESNDAKSIFLAALEVQADQRGSFLDQSCGDDAELRRRVEELLSSHEEAGSFMAHQPGAQFAATVGPQELAEQPGAEIGPYKLLEQIGEGGMGVVYMAEQTAPVTRRVALKIIKPGMDTQQVIARFEAERQALAMMDHPNIAKVLDAGATASGRPYFVMELVKGVPITQFCDARQLTDRQRLELFVAVCQAVQHAHQKGVIHRDLKPSNILVALYDDRPVPKVIDFGVAKAVSQRLTEKTMFTRFGQLVGTFEYMSPEQAKLNQWDVDTRSDIYSLGVLLYELLTGSTPLEKEQLREASFEEALRIIREEEPPRPSLRLSSSAALASIAANRSVEPRRLGQLVRGDLDWIAMKALAKDRTRRYPTALELADDVSRHLRDEPVQAGPPSAAYRLAKFARKHRRAAAAAVSLLAVLLVGLAVSSSLYVRAERLRRLADQAREATALKSDELKQAYADLEDQQQQTRRAYEELKSQQQKTRDALEQERRAAYFNSIALAHNQWQANNVPRADRLLDECPEDLRDWELNYLKRLSNSELLTLRGFKDMVRDAVFSPDGDHLATIDLDGKVKVWDARTGEALLTFRRHSQIPSGVAFSPDGTRIVSASGRPEIGGQRGHGMQDLLRMMLMWGAPGGGEVLVWEPLTGKVLLTLGKEHQGVRSVAFSPDGQRIATTGDDKSIRLWNAETGEQLWSVPEASPIGRLAFSPDGQHIAVGRLMEEKASEITIRTTVDGKLAAVLKEHSSPLVSVAYSPDGKWLASASADQVVVWDASQNVERFRLHVATGLFGNVAAFSSDSRRLAVACMEEKVRLWDVQTGAELPPLRGHVGWVTSIAFDAQGGRLAATAGNVFPSWFTGAEQVGEVKVWDVSRPQDARTLSGHAAAVNAVAFDAAGQAVVSAAEDNSVRVWNVSDGELRHLLEGHTKPVTCVAVSRRGQWIASGSDDQTVCIWDAATGQLQHTLKGHRKGLTSVAFSPGGDRLATAGSDEAVRIWNVEDGRQLLTLFGMARDTAQLSFSPDGKLLVRACKGSTFTNIVQGVVETVAKLPGEVRVWDAGTGRRLAVLEDIGGWVPAICFSGDGRLLAVAEDDVVKLIDVQTWQVVKTLRGEAGEIKDLAFGRAEQRLAAATEKSITIWDLASQREAITIDEGARSVAFDADGWLLATASGKDVRIWDGSPLEAPLEASSSAAASKRAAAQPPVPNDQLAPQDEKADATPQQVRAMERKATRAMQQGDLSGALLWAAGALQKDDDATRAVVHRTRIALLLQSLPRLAEDQPQIRRTPVIPKPSKGFYGWVLGPHARRLAVEMYNVPSTPAEKEEDGRNYRYLLQVFDIQTGRPIGLQRRSPRQFMEEGLAFSPDEQKLAVLQFRRRDKQTVREVQVYDVESGELASPAFQMPVKDSFELSISPDGRWVVAHINPSNLGRRMLVHNTETGKPLELDEPFNVVFFSPQGRLLLSGWNQRARKRLNTVAQLWDARTLARVGSPLDVRLVDQAVFNSNDSVVAIGDGAEVRIFGVKSGDPLGPPIHVGGSSFQMALDPQGRRLALAHGKTLQVWDVGASRSAARVELPRKCTEVEFTPDGLLLALSLGEGRQAAVQLWDALTGAAVSPPLACYASSAFGPFARDKPFRFSQAGRTLFTYPQGDGSQSSGETEVEARLSIWSLDPNRDSAEQLWQLAQLHAGRTIDAAGEPRALTLAEYQSLWRDQRGEHREWFAAAAADVPAELPSVPAAPPAPKKTAARRADYRQTLRDADLEVAPPAVPIIEAMSDPVEGIRRAAVRELRSSELPREMTIRLLAEALYDRTIRKEAAEALGRLGPEAAPAVPQLAEFLENVSRHEAVIWALGRIGPPARDALPAIVPALRNPSPLTRAEAARALVRIDPADTRAVPHLIRNLGDYEQASWPAYQALQQIAAANPMEIVPKLIAYLEDFPSSWGSDEVRARTRAADLLAGIGSEGKDAVAVLRQSLKRRWLPSQCRAAEAHALWRVGGEARRAVTTLTGVLKKDPVAESSWAGSSTYERAADALGEIGPPATQAAPPLRKLLASGEPAERLAAARALWRITGDGGDSVPVLIALLNSADQDIPKPLQARAIEALAEMGPQAKDAAAAIREAMQQEDAENAKQAARGIQVTEIHRDEEDQPPDETALLRTAGVAALHKIDPDAR